MVLDTGKLVYRPTCMTPEFEDDDDDDDDDEGRLGRDDDEELEDVDGSVSGTKRGRES